jgi:hypothetical protein
MVPFPDHSGGSTDRSDPHVTANEWVRAKNADTQAKTYEKIGLDDLNKVDFNRGDRLYVHGHGGMASADRDKVFDKADDNLTSAKLHQKMTESNPDIFNSKKIDVRMASCYSAENDFAKGFAQELGAHAGSGGVVKGYNGQMNVTEMAKLTRRDTLTVKPAFKLANLKKNHRGDLVHNDDESKVVSYPDLTSRTAVRAQKHAVEYPVISKKGRTKE